MTEREIRIGETSACHYVGIKPPVSETAASAIMETLSAHHKFGMRVISKDQRPLGITPENHYTEFCFDINERHDLNNTVALLTHGIAKVLEKQGDTVHIDPGIFPTDYATPLFGEEADNMRETDHILLAARHIQ